MKISLQGYFSRSCSPSQATKHIFRKFYYPTDTHLLPKTIGQVLVTPLRELTFIKQSFFKQPIKYKVHSQGCFVDSLNFSVLPCLVEYAILKFLDSFLFLSLFLYRGTLVVWAVSYLFIIIWVELLVALFCCGYFNMESAMPSSVVIWKCLG